MPSYIESTLSFFNRLRRASTVQKSQQSELELAACHLLLNMTFRLPENAKYDRLVGFRVLWRMLKRPAQNWIQPLSGNENIAIVGATHRNRELIVEYIERSSGKKASAYLAKDFSVFPKSTSPADRMKWFFFALHVSLDCFFSDKRANKALMIFSAVEIASILEYVVENKIQYVYDFIPYEVDGNALSLLLKERGVGITKIPSSGPLTTHNRWMVGDEIILSSAYQLEELKLIDDTIRCAKRTVWPPEKAFTYLHIYQNRPVPPKKTIGYFSHAEWIRREEGHGHNGIDVEGTESEMWRDLIRFISERDGYKLIVFPHPHERKPELKERMEKYYQNLFGAIPFEIIGAEFKTPHAFHLVDVAVVSYSTIIYERLFCGYKLLIATNKIDEFPLNGSPLHHICFKNYEDMAAKIVAAENQSDNEFYESNGLVGYRYFDRPELEAMYK